MKASEIAQLLVSAAALVSSTVLALVAYFGGRRLARLEQHRVMRDDWNALDELALSSPEMLKTAEEVMNPSSTDTQDDLRRKWFSYMALNNLSTAYIMARRGLTANREFIYKMTDFNLSRLMLREDTFLLSQAGYEEEFSRLCRTIHEREMLRRDEPI